MTSALSRNFPPSLAYMSPIPSSAPILVVLGLDPGHPREAYSSASLDRILPLVFGVWFSHLDWAQSNEQ